MSKRKAKMPSASTESRRDWGRVKKKVSLFFLVIIFIMMQVIYYIFTVMQVIMF